MSDLKIPEINLEKSKSIIMITIVIVAVILIFVFGKNIIDFITGLFGGDDAQSSSARSAVKSYDLASTNPSSPFNPQNYLNANSSNLISDSDATDCSLQVYNAAGLLSFINIGIDAGQALAAFKQYCKTQADVSKVSAWFSKLSTTDMYDYMSKYFTSNTNVEIMQQIINYCTSLPATN